jgi:hypothetical protein
MSIGKDARLGIKLRRRGFKKQWGGELPQAGSSIRAILEDGKKRSGRVDV